jgi:hypothetical protein
MHGQENIKFCSEEVACKFSIANDIFVLMYTASWCRRLESSALLMYANSDKNVQWRRNLYYLYVFHVRVLENVLYVTRKKNTHF